MEYLEYYGDLYMIGWDYDTQEEAAEAWNRRANDG